LQNTDGIFFEVSNLDINFFIPKMHKSIALPIINEYKIYLIGGMGSN